MESSGKPVPQKESNCPDCGKAIKKGSLTAWIFSGNSAACTCQAARIRETKQKSQPQLKLQSPAGQVPFGIDFKPDRLIADQYQLDELVGVGGMGAVYRARQTKLNKTFAVKVLRPELLKDKAAVMRFQQEAKAVSNLTHPNLVFVYDFGIDNETPFLVMDYLEGKGLDVVIENQFHLEPNQVVDYFIQAADALEHAHEKRVIHRDIKPSNIIVVDAEGTSIIKIVDFGIAKILPEGDKVTQTLTQTGDVFGSPAYMSPEQCVGDPVNAQSDIYSLGCVMFETLTGKPPFTSANPVQTILQHINNLPPNLVRDYSTLKIPEPLAYVVGRCLEKNPVDRYQSAIALKADLEAVRDGKEFQRVTPKRERSDAQSKSLAILQKRSRVYKIGLAVAGIALIACAFLLVRQDSSKAGSESVDIKEAWLQLDQDGQSKFNHGELDQAKSVFDKLLAISEKSEGNQERLVGSLNEEIDLAKARASHQDLTLYQTRLDGIRQEGTAPARAMKEELDLALQNHLKDPERKELVNRANDLIGTLIESGYYKQATTLVFKTGILMNNAQTAENVRTIHNAGYLAHVTGDWKGARMKYDEALRVERAALPAQDPSTAMTLLMMARLGLQSGDSKPQQIGAWLDEALSIYRASNRRKDMGWVRYHMAALAHQEKDKTKALKEVEAALALLPDFHGTDNKYLASCRLLEGMIKSDYDLQAQSLQLAQTDVNKDYPLLFKALTTLGTTLSDVVLLNRALAMTHRFPAEQMKLDYQLHNQIVDIHRRKNQTETALISANEVLACAKNLFGPQSNETFLALYQLGKLYDDLGHKKIAKENFEQCNQMIEKAKSPGKLKSTAAYKDVQTRLERLAKELDFK